MMNLLDLVDLVDTNLAGLAFRNSTKLSPAVFVAGFLQEIIQSESFRVAVRPLQEKLRHLSFLVHLMVRLEDTELACQEFLLVQADLESRVTTWEDEQYFRSWESKVWNSIFFQPGVAGGLKTDPGQEEEEELSFVLEDVKSGLSDPALLLDREEKNPGMKLELTEMMAAAVPAVEQEAEEEEQLAETDFSCGLCHLRASSREELLLHVKTSHPTEAVSITHFTKAVARKAVKRKAATINTCDICKVSFCQLKLFEKHKFEFHGETYCHCCERNYDDFEKYFQHLKHVCVICQKKVNISFRQNCIYI